MKRTLVLFAAFTFILTGAVPALAEDNPLEFSGSLSYRLEWFDARPERLEGRFEIGPLRESPHAYIVGGHVFPCDGRS